MSIDATKWAIMQDTGSPMAKSILMLLAIRQNYRSKDCYPSHAAIARDTEMSLSAVKKHLETLSELGLVTIDHRFYGKTKQTSNLYTLNTGAGNQSPQSEEVAIKRPRGGRDVATNIELKEETKHIEENDADASSLQGKSSIPYNAILDSYHKHLPNLPGVLRLNTKRKTQLKKLWLQDAVHREIGFWDWYFSGMRKSAFHMGENDRGWRADFDFLITESKFLKLTEKLVSIGHSLDE